VNRLRLASNFFLPFLSFLLLWISYQNIFNSQSVLLPSFEISFLQKLDHAFILVVHEIYAFNDPGVVLLSSPQLQGKILDKTVIINSEVVLVELTKKRGGYGIFP
jgi:hypothetical protein